MHKYRYVILAFASASFFVVTVASAAAQPWSFNGKKWVSDGKAPACAKKIVLKPPVDLALATAVLYPGQTRGGNYKPHGGFRFDNSSNDDITVRAPMDGYITKASRFIESGEVQYFFFFINPCGIAYKFDHLRVLSKPLQKIANNLPQPKENDSRTTVVSPPVAVKAGAVLATSVGFAQTRNVSVDFGVYDLRKQNSVSKNKTWLGQPAVDKEYGYHGVCWLDMFSSKNISTVRALPGGDTQQGTMSDYCK